MRRLAKLVQLVPLADLRRVEHERDAACAAAYDAGERVAAVRAHFLNRLAEEAKEQTRLRNELAVASRRITKLHGRLGSLTAQLNRAVAAIADRGD